MLITRKKFIEMSVNQLTESHKPGEGSWFFMNLCRKYRAKKGCFQIKKIKNIQANCQITWIQ